jgi:hypothetical protein
MNSAVSCFYLLFFPLGRLELTASFPFEPAFAHRNQAVLNQIVENLLQLCAIRHLELAEALELLPVFAPHVPKGLLGLFVETLVEKRKPVPEVRNRLRFLQLNRSRTSGRMSPSIRFLSDLCFWLNYWSSFLGMPHLDISPC